MRSHLTPAMVSRFRRALLRWGRKNRRTFPWRNEHDPFRVLVAEVLLQRSRGTTVAAVYEDLFSRWSRPEDLADASIEELSDTIRPLGLVGRAKHLKALSARIHELGAVPREASTLTRLPGVGTYAANATLVAAFNKPVPVVDGVTARVYRRYFNLESDLPPVADPDLWRLVAEVSPRSVARDWNWAVLDLASAICMPKVPRCESCPLESQCAYGQRRRQ